MNAVYGPARHVEYIADLLPGAVLEIAVTKEELLVVIFELVDRRAHSAFQVHQGVDLGVDLTLNGVDFFDAPYAVFCAADRRGGL